ARCALATELSSPPCLSPAPRPGSPSAWRRSSARASSRRRTHCRPFSATGRTTASPRVYRSRSMNQDEILRGLYDQTLVGNGPAVLELTQAGLAAGMTPDSLLFDALIPSLEEVGARFERGDFFVPEMLIAGRAMAGALEVLRPLLAETGAATL